MADQKESGGDTGSRFSFTEIHTYLRSKNYPQGLDKSGKSVLRRRAKFFVVDQGDLYYIGGGANTSKSMTPRLVVEDVEKQRRIVSSTHDMSHFGVHRTNDTVSRKYYWPGLFSDVKRYVESCDRCQRQNKLKKSVGTLHPIPVKSELFHQMGMDLIGPLPETTRGNKYIVTVTDYFSKWAEAAPLPSKHAAGISKFIYSVMCRFGCPQTLITDQGREFVNKLSSELYALTKTHHRITSAYHPQTNGLTERFNQTLCQCLAKLSNEEQSDWDDKIDCILMGYRASFQSSTKHSPYYMLFQQNMRLPIDCDSLQTCNEKNDDEVKLDEVMKSLLESRKKVFSEVEINITKAQEKQKNTYDRKHELTTIQIGSDVLLENTAQKQRKGGKLEPAWLGPYIVSKCVGKGLYELSRNDKIIKTKANVARLKVYRKRSLKEMQLPSQDEAENQVYRSGMSDEGKIDSAPVPVNEVQEAPRKKQRLGIEERDKDSNSFQLSDLGSDESFCNMISLSSPTNTSSRENSELIQESLQSTTCQKELMSSFGSQVSVPPASSQLRKSECTSKDQEFQNYVVTFQAITKESLISKLTPFISILERIKMGELQEHECPSYNDFINTSCKKLQMLKNRSHSITCMTISQFEEVVAFLLSKFCCNDKSSSIFSYTMDVLLPEALCLIIMDMFSVSMSEARSIMYTYVCKNHSVTLQNVPATTASVFGPESWKLYEDLKKKFDAKKYEGNKGKQVKPAKITTQVKPGCSTSPQLSCSKTNDTSNSSSIVVDDSTIFNNELNYWNKRLGLLTADQEMLKRGKWLTDKHINAASLLIKEEFPEQHGLQDTLLLQHFDQYESENSQFVQIVHVNGNHWLCVSNKFCPAGTVDVYDCSPGTGFSPSLKRQIAVVLKCEYSNFTIRLVEVQRQIGNADCGLFSIAFAYALCCGLDPHSIQFDQSVMRAHFDLCVDKEKIDMFPVSTRCRRKNTKSRIKSEKKVPVFCTCRLPWDKADTEKGPLVKCFQCKEWYHSKCDNINLELYDTNNYCCNSCL